MWTRLVAGTTAHDVNNLAQGLLNLMMLAEDPGATRETLAQYAELARGGIAELRRLGTDLRVLADAHAGEGPQRLELACADALVEVEPPAGRRVERGDLSAKVVVRASAAGLRQAVASLLGHALAASAPGSAVRIEASADATGGAVIIDAPGAPALRVAEETPVSALLTGPDRELSGGRLVLAGALADEYAGALTVQPGPVSGQRLRLWIPR